MVEYFLPIENFYNLNLATLKVLGPLFNQVFQFGRHFEAIGQLLGGNSQKLRMTFYQINASFGDFSDELDSTSLKSPSLDRGLELMLNKKNVPVNGILKIQVIGLGLV